MGMTKLTKDEFIPFLDVNQDETYKTNIWRRVDLSTIFELSAGEEEENRDYICYKNPVTEIKSSKPELPQEIAIYEGNPIYDFMSNHFYNLPIGSQCKVPALLCFGGANKLAWRSMVTITSKKVNSVDGKISFTMKFGGDIDKGVYTISNGVPVFVEATSKDVSLAGENVEWKNVKGDTITKVSGLPGNTALARPVAGAGKTIKDVIDSNSKEYEVAGDGYVVIQLGQEITVTARTKDATTNADVVFNKKSK